MKEEYTKLIGKCMEEEQTLLFDSFSNEEAAKLGHLVYEVAKDKKLPVSIQIRRAGQILYHVALEGTTADNDEWLRRKSNAVMRFGKSSYHLGLELREAGKSLLEMYEVKTDDYAAHGGCFPIVVKGVGLVGTVAVSGLEQSLDHTLVVKCVREYLQ